MREREIEQVLVTEVRKIGGRAYKWISPGNDGVPDRILFFPDGRHVFVELKADKGRLTRLQQLQIKRLRELLQPVYVVRGISGVSQFFHDWGYADIGRAIDRKYDL